MHNTLMPALSTQRALRIHSLFKRKAVQFAHLLTAPDWVDEKNCQLGI